MAATMAMNNIMEITGRFIGENFRFTNPDGDVIIGEIEWKKEQESARVAAMEFVAGEFDDDVIKIKGQAEQRELREGQTYRFYGRWTEYKNKRSGKTETQFAFDSFVIDRPYDREGVIGYLAAHGDGHGLGAKRCQKLWDIFGVDAIRMVREQPEVVVEELARVGYPLAADKLKHVIESLKDEEFLEATTLEVMALLTGHRFPKRLIKLVIKEWGNAAADKIKADPYALLKKFPGCGFKRCDALYLYLKHDPAAMRRQALCAWYEVVSDTSGNTWVPRSKAVEGVLRNISGTDAKPDEAIALAVREGLLTEIRTDGVNGPISERGSHGWIAETEKATQEEQLAKMLAVANKEKPHWPTLAEIKAVEPRITPHQLEELGKAFSGGPIAMLGGGPGCGKTFVACAVIKALNARRGSASIGAAAPTGKAAVRVSENLANYKLEVRARTWASTIIRADMEVEEPPGMFHFQVIAGDETSMNPVPMMWNIMRRRRKGTHILFIGDVFQLSPIEHGAPLRDMIEAKLPYGQLTEVQRNSGMIVAACAKIRQGLGYEVLRSLDEVDFQEDRPAAERSPRNLVRLNASTPEQAVEQMRRVMYWAKQHDIDPIEGCQVIAPIGKRGKSPLGCPELNKILQADLNVNTEIPGVPFRVGDKIVNTKNDFFESTVKVNENDEELIVKNNKLVYVANGELAIVEDVRDRVVYAKLTAPERSIKITLGKQQETTDADADKPATDDADDKTGTGCSWILGYAYTIHKSQGSEVKVVVVMLDPSAKRLNSREILYTADSRGKMLTVEIGADQTVREMLRNVTLWKRKTLLKERILLEKAKLELGDL